MTEGRFDEAMGRVREDAMRKRHVIPLSKAASDARRPQKPALLLEAEQDRPDIPAESQTVRARRAVKSTG